MRASEGCPNEVSLSIKYLFLVKHYTRFAKRKKNHYSKLYQENLEAAVNLVSINVFKKSSKNKFWVGGLVFSLQGRSSFHLETLTVASQGQSLFIVAAKV